MLESPLPTRRQGDIRLPSQAASDRDLRSVSRSRAVRYCCGGRPDQLAYTLPPTATISTLLRPREPPKQGADRWTRYASHSSASRLPRILPVSPGWTDNAATAGDAVRWLYRLTVLLLWRTSVVIMQALLQLVTHQRPNLVDGVLARDLAAQFGVEVLGRGAGGLTGHGEAVAQHQHAES